MARDFLCRPLHLWAKVVRASMVVAAQKRARPKAAPPLRINVVSAPSMERMEHASLMAAPAVEAVDRSIASNTVGRRTSRAPCRAALPPLNARVSVPNTAVERIHALFQAAPTRWSASS